MTSRTYGIELEIVTTLTQSQIASVLNAAGIDTEARYYTHEVTSYWKVTTDSSVRGGYELVSPILSGEAGLEAIRTVCQALTNAGVTVNKTCGFHLHICENDLSFKAIANMTKWYAKWEDVLDAMLPESRRKNNNQYCQSVTGHNFDRATTVNDLINELQTRYKKLNLQSYGRYGTIEIRQHSGTVDAEKVVNWVRLMVAAVEYNAKTRTVKAWSTTNLKLTDKARVMLRVLDIPAETSKYAISRIRHFQGATA